MRPPSRVVASPRTSASGNEAARLGAALGARHQLDSSRTGSERGEPGQQDRSGGFR